LTNRLIHETSPYLLQHAENPVDWWPWGEEALIEAARTGKPILLSVGYAACHWCHVMAHESFEDAETAEVMNALFVNVKVDREERPDIDQIYMSALQALGVHGGWPMTMFLTPDGAPFWGGTYFPKEARYGQPAFVDVLNAVAASLSAKPDQVAQNRQALLAHLSDRRAARGSDLDEELLGLAADRLLSIMDPVEGGLRGAPKFPQAGLLGLLWRYGRWSGEARYGEAVVHTLERICNGGIYDHLGGGFARYAVDDRWLVPHFEKMLYDNGQLLGLLADTLLTTGSDLFRRRIEETVAWILREMRLPHGGLASSLDADSEGEEGRFYVWTRGEIETALGPGADDFCRVYDVTDRGNWEGRTILNRLDSAEEQIDEEAMGRLRKVLLTERNRRVPPGRDDKVLADWNGLAIAGLARAALACDRSDWIDLARGAYRFVCESMSRDGRLGHSSRDGRLVFPGMATDHAAMAAAALALHQATFEPAFLADAEAWLGELDARYRDDDGSYFLTADDAAALIVRPKPVIDEATPNANAVIADVSVALHLLTGASEHLDRADRIFSALGPQVGRNIVGMAGLLCAFVRRLDLASVVVVGPESPERRALIAAARRHAPSAVVFAAESTAGLGDGHPATGKTTVSDATAAYLCRGSTCSLPVTDGDAFAALVAEGDGAPFPG